MARLQSPAAAVAGRRSVTRKRTSSPISKVPHSASGTTQGAAEELLRRRAARGGARRRAAGTGSAAHAREGIAAGFRAAPDGGYLEISGLEGISSEALEAGCAAGSRQTK